MEDAGSDLEDQPIPNVFVIWDIFWSAAIALAKAEASCQFEHRDLHEGNICVRWPDKEKSGRLIGRWDAKVHLTGVDVTVIDYTLSRAVVEVDSTSDKISLDSDESETVVKFKDLEEDDLFDTESIFVSAPVILG